VKTQWMDKLQSSSKTTRKWKVDVLFSPCVSSSTLLQAKENVRGAVNQVLGTAGRRGEETKDAGKKTLEETKQRTSGAYEDAKSEGKKNWNK